MYFDWAQPELSYTIYTESKAWRNEGFGYLRVHRISVFRTVYTDITDITEYS